MPHLYSVKKVGDEVVVESQNANAKQVFFGWAGAGIASAFYGDEVRGSWGPKRELRWRWKLSPVAAEIMLQNVHRQLTDPDFLDRSQSAAARELQRKLSEVGRSTKRRSRR